MTEASNTISAARTESTANLSIPRAAYPGWPLPDIAADDWDAPLRALIDEGMALCAYKNRCNHEMVVTHLNGTLRRDSARLSDPTRQAADDLEALVNNVARRPSATGEALLGKAMLLRAAARASIVPEPLYALGWSIAMDLNTRGMLRWRLLESPGPLERRRGAIVEAEADTPTRTD